MTPKKLTGNEIRQTFIDFFVEHGHTAVPSASLVYGDIIPAMRIKVELTSAAALATSAARAMGCNINL